MKIQFHTRAYERSHGKAPNGRGNWLFEIVAIDGAAPEEFPGEPDSDIYTVPFPSPTTLAEAKKQIRSRIIDDATYIAGGIPREIDVDILP